MFDFIFGYCEYEVSAEDISRLLDGMIFLGLPFRNVRESGGVYRFRSPLNSYYATVSLAEKKKAGIKCRRGGLPVLLISSRKNVGVIIGIVLSVLIAVRVSGYVWEIGISGTGGYTSGQIEEAAKEAGIFRGADKKEIDPSSAALQIRLALPKSSFVSVNLRGTKAQIVIRERLPSTVIDLSFTSNLIASCDGVVSSFTVQSGDLLVAVGTQVRQGDIIVSGIHNYQTGLSTATRSRGEVYAAVSEEYTVFCPFSFTQTAPTGEVISLKTASFSEYNIKLYRKQIDLPEKYVIMEKEKNITIFGRQLPVKIKETEYIAVAETETVLTPAEAELRCYSMYGELLESLASEGDILSLLCDAEQKEDGYYINLRVDRIKNIAVEQKLG